MKSLFNRYGYLPTVLLLSYILYEALKLTILVLEKTQFWGRLLLFAVIITYCLSISKIGTCTKNYYKKKNQSNSLIENLPSLPWRLLFIALHICFFLFPYYYIKLGYNFCGYFALLAEAIFAVILLISFIVIKCTNLYRSKISLRRLVMIDLYVTLFAIAIGGIVIGLKYWYHIPLSGTNLMIYHLAIPALDALLICYSTMMIYIALQSYEERNYILYLRNFKFDKSEQNDDIIARISEVNKKVLRIGNPRTLFALDYNLTTFYLPETDWQNEVSKLINESKLCFIVLDISDGVLWEVCNHLDKKEKFIYHITKFKNIDLMCCKLRKEYNKGECESFIKSLELLKENAGYNEEQSCTFFILDGTLYYHHDIKKSVSIMQWKSSNIEQSEMSRIHIHRNQSNRPTY